MFLKLRSTTEKTLLEQLGQLKAKQYLFMLNWKTSGKIDFGEK